MKILINLIFKIYEENVFKKYVDKYKFNEMYKYEIDN